MIRSFLIYFTILAFCMLCGVRNVHSQNQSVVDSLMNIVNSIPDDTGKVDLLLAIGYEYELNDPEKSIIYYKQALKVAKSTQKPVFESYCYEYLGIVNMINFAKYDSAEIYLKQCMNIRKEVLGEKHPDYANSLNNLAELYNKTCNYAAAEPLYLNANKIFKEVLGEKDPNYAQSISNLAEFYRVIGNYPAAEPLLLESKSINKEILGEKDPYYATTLNNLALLYYEMNKYQDAESLFIEAKNIWKELLGEKSSDYASALNNLAGLYKAMGKYKEAEMCFLEANNIDKEIFGVKHPDYAQSLNNLAFLYNETGKYKAAEVLFQEAKKIRKDVFGEKHPSYAASVNNLAKLYSNMGNYSMATGFYLEGLKIINYTINQNFTFLSEKEKELYFNTLTGTFDSFYSFAMKRKAVDKDITKTVFDNVVKNKGLLLKSSTAMRTAILNSNDTILISKYLKWINLKKEISEIYSTESSKREKNPEEIEQIANEIEKDLVRDSQVLSDYKKIQNLTWETVKNNLKAGEAAIEFLHFTEGKKNDTVTYCALIITPQCKQPEMVRLFEEKEITAILGSEKDNNFSLINLVYGSHQDLNQALYKLIWQPIEPYLKNLKSIYYSPDGILHKVSFAAIGKGKNVFLCDNLNLFPVSSTGKIYENENVIIEKDFTSCIIGGIDYTGDSTANTIWKYLPGTLKEAIAIKAKFSEKNILATIYSGKDATELTFKNIYCKNSTPPSILHIATHGYFYPDPQQEKVEKNNNYKEHGEVLFRGNNSGFGLWQFVKNKNPLMRSGLALAGANNVWNDPYAGTDNEGVLTAQEVTQLDMSKTKIIVLSACETGLGDIKGSEGVYGLQRAFKMAGVRYIIMSLWQVPDKETVEFMETFYAKLLIKKDIRSAFSETQKEMRTKYDPYFWGAFVLIE